ncbi:hydrogenase iron-sulfur subunit [Calderihabitans maritimus]|uniref:Methyl-viologen-reducing hydrogenase subunit delta n=1 Tax=Calderihabitans maritimus TaxID=1246530 RepID=A0A1Z5HQN5_9FIRM|nr:hydrogenase iron-sulfur subunit [Calderihabitans maritimus]GAW91748.1 methyl-viologen-reducing hydrogenase subunit delta [Calderihabitans maritimus]
MDKAQIGLYICRCNNQISQSIDTNKLASVMRKKKGVAICREHDSICGPEGQQMIREDIRDGKVNTVVIAACSPRLYQKTMANALGEVGLNKYLLEWSNIREQCAWVHSDDPQKAYKKAVNLVSMSLAKARLLKPLEPLRFPSVKSALVVGGGIAGLSACLDLAEARVQVVLVEKEPTVGGKVALLHKYFPRMCNPACGLDFLLQKIRAHDNISIHTLTEIKSISGGPGNFEVTLVTKPRYIMPDRCTACGECTKVCPATRNNHWDFGYSQTRAVYFPHEFAYPHSYIIDRSSCPAGCTLCQDTCPAAAIRLDQSEKEFTVNVGSILLATGWEPYPVERVEQYGYKRFANVVTNMGFERLASPTGPTKGQLVRLTDGKPVKKIAFIQCVGSRDQNYLPYCSQVCCTATLKQIQYVREANPEAEIYVFYMDIRSVGEYEKMYRQAQEESMAIFIRGNPSNIREDPDTKQLIIQAEDTLLGEQLEVKVDMVVLAAGMQGVDGLKDVTFKVNLPVENEASIKNEEIGGEISPGHLQCFPYESQRTGIFLAGSCQGGMDVSTSIKSAAGAAMKAMAFLQDEIVLKPTVPVIDKLKCDKCKRCMEECPFDAWEWDDTGYPAPNLLKCRQCGICQGGCPMKAISLQNFTIKQLAKMVEAVDTGFLGEGEPIILAFVCANDAYPAVDLVGQYRRSYPANVIVVKVPCIGSINVALVADALSHGYDGVILAGCKSDECHFVRGSDLAKTRLENMRETLQRMMIEPDRVKSVELKINDGERFIELVTRFVAELKQLGPNPFKA